MTYADHDHRGEYASDGHDHYDYAALHHRHYDDESRVSGLSEGLRLAEERINELENDLRDAFERIRALEDGPVPGGGADPDRPETWAFGEPPVIAYPDHETPEERGVSEYNREESALEHPEEPW